MSKKYDTFAAYLEDVYYNQIFSKIKSYLYNNQGRLDLSTSAVPDPSYVELSDFKIMGVNFHESDTDKIECKVTVRAEIEISGRGRRDYESDLTECWLSIPFAATLKNGLQQVRIGYASEYSRELFRAEDALTKYLVPYIYAKDLDKHAERFLEKYCPRALEEPMPLPIEEIVDSMGLTVYHAPLPDGIFGRTYFNDANVEVFANKACTETAERSICPGTILVNPDVFFMRNIGSTNNTVIHECVHWDKHYKFFELQKLLNPEIQAISCAVVEEYKKKANQLEDELSWMEWQANMSNSTKLANPMKVITGKDTRWSYANVWEAKSINGGTPKFSVSLIIPKTDTVTVQKIKAAIQAAYEEGQAKLKGNGRTVPPLTAIKTPLRDGDTERPDDPAYAGSYFINANSATAPGIVDADCNPILTRSEVYSGVYGRASINFYAFNSNGNKGIACGLNNLQKIRDGEPLGGKSSAASDFSTDADEDFLS